MSGTAGVHGELGTLYLLHFDPPLCHARHYLGWARDLEPRLAAHRAGRGSALTAAVIAAGGGRIEFARTWEAVARHFERQLKNRHEAPRLCPLCVAARLTGGRGLLRPTPGEIAA